MKAPHNHFTIQVKPLFVFILTFIAFTPIGTISHEYGHIAAAECLGYDTELYYDSMSWSNDPNSRRRTGLYKKYEQEIKDQVDFPEREEYERLRLKQLNDILLITIGGPLQTLSVGCLGLLMLYFRRKVWKENGLQRMDWLAIFLSLFWLREVFNLVVSLAVGLVKGDGNYFGERGDEVRIANILNLPSGTFSILLGSLGLLIACIIIFKIIPKPLRFTFIIGGLVGGTAGFVLWMYWLGPILLP